MLSIFANTLMAATLRQPTAPRREAGAVNPLAQVRTGGLTLSPRKRA